MTFHSWHQPSRVTFSWQTDIPFLFCNLIWLCLLCESELILNLPMFSAHKNNWSAAKINWLVSMWWEDETRIYFRVYFRIYFVVCFKYERRVLSWPICFSRSNSIWKYLCKLTNKYFDKYKTAKIWMIRVHFNNASHIRDEQKGYAMRDWVPFIQFKNREKYPFFICTNDVKSPKVSQMLVTKKLKY